MLGGSQTKLLMEECILRLILSVKYARFGWRSNTMASAVTFNDLAQVAYVGQALFHVNGV